MTKKTIPTEFVSRSAGDIAERAYAIYAERGRIDGLDREDWLRAERELRTAPSVPARTGSSSTSN